jgi:hypothetical protein
MLAATPAQGNLVLNGGFETEDFTDWSTQGLVGDSLLVADGVAHTGTSFVVFQRAGFVYDEIFQVLPTSSGQSYHLQFWLANFDQGDDSFQVLWEGSLVLDLTPPAIALEVWTLFTLDLPATMDGSELRFRGHDDPATLRLDDVSVTAVPVPGAVVLGCLGLGGLSTRRRMGR